MYDDGMYPGVYQVKNFWYSKCVMILAIYKELVLIYKKFQAELVKPAFLLYVIPFLQILHC
jgi:hypothetical protein